MLYGLLNLSLWGYIFAGCILTQITIAAVTLYLHRCQTHRAIYLHSSISHFFRFWLWLTTGMKTADWVAIHRKHHAHTDMQGDPHSPVVLGIKKVFWEGAELYREACKDQQMIEKYSHGTPKDWIEKNIYSKYSTTGVMLMLFLDLLFFGLPGLSIWAIQMIWIPVFAAGVVNGVGHYWGYRNFECKDAATNFFPWGFWIGGEELHNNHHSFASSAKFSIKWWEFDLGWMYIRILSFFKLAKVKKLPPKLVSRAGRFAVDIETVKAVISNRLQVMRNYYKIVLKPVLKEQKNQQSSRRKKIFSRAAMLLRKEDTLLNFRSRQRLQSLLDYCEPLKILYAYKHSLQNIWLKTAANQKELIEALQEWCRQAEASGIEVLIQFSNQIKAYVPQYRTV